MTDVGGDPPCWASTVVDHRDAAPALPDLATPAAVHDLVTRFYREIVFDELLEPIFAEVAEVDWAEHIPNLIDYWCWILFGADGFAGSVTKTHRHLHGLQPIEPVHCDRWIALWFATVDADWSGPIAERAKSHAARLMAGMAKHMFGFSWTAPKPTNAVDSFAHVEL
ncbi:group III truncated hemoglobin [Aquihabitans daechungensis]|uniref:group III truncated hemoglobin n=1 Tax=Aquihabitans daechungensis TaxID=1052257 RepID=UPI003BA0626B